MSDDQLRTCPFCGGAPYVHDNDWSDPDTYSVHCKCGAMMGGTHIERASAIAAWNTRAGWQPIATAPTDDDVWNVGVTVWVNDEMRVGVRDWEDPQNLHLWLDLYTGLPFDRDAEPTHWRPLPEPPPTS